MRRLFLINNLVNKIRKVTNETKQKISKLKNRNKTIKIRNKLLNVKNNSQSRNNPELNEQISDLMKNVEQMMSIVNSLINKNTNKSIRTSIEIINEYIIQILELISSNNKTKYEIIREKIQYIKQFIYDIIDKKQPFVLNDDLDKISRVILGKIDNIVITNIDTVNIDIKMLEKELKQKLQERNEINAKLKRNIENTKRSLYSYVSSNSKKAYNLRVATIQNNAISQQKNLNREISYLQNHITKLKRIK